MRSMIALILLPLGACEAPSEPVLGASHAGQGNRPGQDAAVDSDALDGGRAPSGGAADAGYALHDASFDAAVADNAPDAANAACNEDAREPDNHTSDAERHDPVQGIVPVELEGMVACPGDRDVVWAGFVDAGAKAGAVLTWDASLGELALSLGDADDMPILKRDVSTASAGRAEERVNEYYDSYFYVRVENRGNVSIPYTLTVTAQVFGP